LPGTRCYYFDSIGVPSPEAMIGEFGSGEAWQAEMTRRWVARLAENSDGARVAILDGQVRPSIMRAALTESGMTKAAMLLVDCSAGVRDARLRARGQPELATSEMTNWAAYLRGQADALGLFVIDTSDSSVETSIAAMVEWIRLMVEGD
ncbi:MAG: hypothetical protein ABJD11_10770, partial [Gemmatimonadota bacterium]